MIVTCSFQTAYSQIGRQADLWVVGSNEITAPIIEVKLQEISWATARTIACHSIHFYLAAVRHQPTSALFGQLSALVGFDPTSRTALAHEISPRVIAWQDRMEDMSGLEPSGRVTG